MTRRSAGMWDTCKVFSVLLLLSGCSVKTTINRTAQDGFVVTSKRDAVVIVDGSRIIVDNRGHRSYLDLLLSHIIGDTEKSVNVEYGSSTSKEVVIE